MRSVCIRWRPLWKAGNAGKATKAGGDVGSVNETCEVACEQCSRLHVGLVQKGEDGV